MLRKLRKLAKHGFGWRLRLNRKKKPRSVPEERTQNFKIIKVDAPGVRAIIPVPKEGSQTFRRIGLEGDRVEHFYQDLKRTVRIERETEHLDPNWKRIRSYAKILSVIYEGTGGALRGKNILEIGPGDMTRPLEILRKDGANIFSIEPDPSKELLRVARNAEDLFAIRRAHKGVKFDFVFSRGVFEFYSAEKYSGLAPLEKKNKRVRFLKRLSRRMNDGATLIISEILTSEPGMIKRGELERAGFEIIVDSDILLDHKRAPFLESFGKERFIIARKKPKSRRIRTKRPHH